MVTKRFFILVFVGDDAVDAGPLGVVVARSVSRQGVTAVRVNLEMNQGIIMQIKSSIARISCSSG